MTNYTTLTPTQKPYRSEKVVADLLGERAWSDKSHALLVAMDGDLGAICGAGIINARGHAGSRRTEPLYEVKGAARDATCKRCQNGLTRRGL